jgi:protein-disulfide isomerase
MRQMTAVSVLALLAACAGGPDDMRELREGQRAIQAKLTDLEKKIDQIASRPAAAPAAQVDPNKIYNLPAGASPFKGPASAPVVLTEFSDFQ